MAFDFPQTPTLGEEYTSNGQTYTYTGIGWAIKSDIFTQVESDTRYVNISGDTMTGDLTINKVSAYLILDKTASGQSTRITGRLNGLARWNFNMGNGDPEGGSNTGSNFTLSRCNDDGTTIDSPMLINRATGATTWGGDLTVTKDRPYIYLNKTANPDAAIVGRKNGLDRWTLSIGDGTVETGSDFGSNFSLYRYSDTGAYLANPLTVVRANGIVMINTAIASISPTTGALTVAGGVGVAGQLTVGGGASIYGGGFLQFNRPDNGNQFKIAFSSNDLLLRWNFNDGATLMTFDNGGTISTTGKINIERNGFGVLPPSPVASINMSIPGNATGIAVRPGAPDIAYWPLYLENYNTGHIGGILANQTTTAFQTTSDERLKEDLKSFDAGHIVDGIEVYDFAWKETGTRAYGVIAQQAKDIYDAPTYYDEKSDRWFVDYSKYVPVLLQELKALRARVMELEGKVEIGMMK